MTVSESHMTGSFLSGEGLPANVVRFARFLRVNDIPVTLSSVLDAITSLGFVDVSNLELFKNLLRCNFTTNKDEMAVFNALFERFWLSPAADASQSIADPAAAAHPDADKMRPARQQLLFRAVWLMMIQERDRPNRCDIAHGRWRAKNRVNRFVSKNRPPSTGPWSAC